MMLASSANLVTKFVGKYCLLVNQKPQISGKRAFQKKQLPQFTTKRNAAQTYIQTPKFESDEISNESVFSWSKQWYPIQVLVHLDGSRPTAVQLLGKDLVLWRDGEGKWACFEDACPHRLVPLSEGRIETDGTLQCAYHAWRFNAKGECVKIPQAEAEMADKLCGNEKGCANVYPTQEKYGLLWVWGESGKNASLECLLKSPVVPPALETAQINVKQWMFQDLPYSQEFLLENALDPAHVTVSHHGVEKFNRNDAQPMYFKLKKNGDDDVSDGFLLFRSDGQPLDNTKSDEELEKGSFFGFYPPGAIVHQWTFANFFRQLFLLATPTTHGTSRVFYIFSGNLPEPMISLPAWLWHLRENIFLQQDSVFLAKQEQKINQIKDQNSVVSKLYYMPTISDLGVVELHKWLGMHAQGGVTYAPGTVPKIYSDNELTDTYNGHTKNCNYCQDALANFQKLQIAAWFSCAVFAACTICSAIIKPLISVDLFQMLIWMPSFQVLVFGFLSLIFGVVGKYASNMVPRFFETKYSHSDN
eukprot:TRINITY_DN4626_c0_g1_i1.p1 TRINITY_DN4626_c0_g1~~TRINITY_DN4626_c0_g1_i1.p1  ORF type:complete len:530 (-),score=73.31 TRINITY_DN4626_c0_g1_i1:1081-2670(-)